MSMIIIKNKINIFNQAELVLPFTFILYVK